MAAPVKRDGLLRQTRTQRQAEVIRLIPRARAATVEREVDGVVIVYPFPRQRSTRAEIEAVRVAETSRNHPRRIL
jgi:hypothetical protein